MNVNRLEQTLSELRADELRTNSRAADNSTFAIGGVSCSADSFVVTESSVLRINFVLKSPPIANLQTVKTQKSQISRLGFLM